VKKILVVLPVEKKHKERLERNSRECEFEYVNIKDVTGDKVQSADFIVGNVPCNYIRESPKLKLLQLNSAGTDNYTEPGVLAPGTILTNATGAYGKSVAEHMFAVMMTLQKKLHLYRDDRLKGGWNDYGTVTSIADATVVVVGLGNIGTHFAGMAKALGAHVIGVKRRPSVCPSQVDELFLMEDLKKVLPMADVVFSILPDTKATRQIYNKELFESMKRTGIFLNAGRGNAVDQEALLWALQNKRIMAAGLDVTNPEPLPAEHPLWQEENVLITPHVSGQYHLPETLDKIIEIAAANIEAYLSGKALINVVDMESGYCR